MERLKWDEGEERFDLAGQGIHCGEVIEVEIDGHWMLARVEFDHERGAMNRRLGWYAILPAGACVILSGGLTARLPARE